LLCPFDIEIQETFANQGNHPNSFLLIYPSLHDALSLKPAISYQNQQSYGHSLFQEQQS
jgi:hypothetical protein